MLRTIADVFTTLYGTVPLLIWVGVLGLVVALAVTLTTLSLCRASGQADERTELMAADCREQPR